MGFVFDIQAAKQQSALGKYNQQVANRNAVVKEQEAEAIKKQTEFDIVKFDQQFEQLTGETKVATLKSGVELSGSALNILRYNAEQAEVQKDVMEYNSQVAQSKKIEQANFARINAQMAREQARMAQYQTIASTSTSLLNMSNFGTTTNNKTYTGFGQSGYGRDPGDIM